MGTLPHLLAPWQWVWRNALAPSLSDAELAALSKGLADDDPALIQGQTLEPLPCPASDDRPPCGACALAYGVWKGSPLELTAAEVEARFAAVVLGCDPTLGHEAAARPFIEFWDGTARDLARRALYREVRASIEERRHPALPSAPVTSGRAGGWTA